MFVVIKAACEHGLSGLMVSNQPLRGRFWVLKMQYDYCVIQIQRWQVIPAEKRHALPETDFIDSLSLVACKWL
jgi:hypothetical protein